MHKFKCIKVQINEKLLYIYCQFLFLLMYVCCNIKCEIQLYLHTKLFNFFLIEGIFYTRGTRIQLYLCRETCKSYFILPNEENTGNGISFNICGVYVYVSSIEVYGPIKH